MLGEPVPPLSLVEPLLVPPLAGLLGLCWSRQRCRSGPVRPTQLADESPDELLAPVPALPVLGLVVALPVLELSEEPPMPELEAPDDDGAPVPPPPPMPPPALAPPCAQATLATPSSAAVTAAPSVFMFTIKSPEWLGKELQRVEVQAQCLRAPARRTLTTD